MEVTTKRILSSTAPFLSLYSPCSLLGWLSGHDILRPFRRCYSKNQVRPWYTIREGSSDISGRKQELGNILLLYWHIKFKASKFTLTFYAVVVVWKEKKKPSRFFQWCSNLEAKTGLAERAPCQAVHLHRCAGQPGWVLGIAGIIPVSLTALPALNESGG